VVAAKKAIRKAFDHQVEKKGFSFIEILCTCPTNWHMTTEQALNYVATDMQKRYPLGVFKDTSKEEK
jgi:2-oxoglutarate ferredoxin oxidoreductase subunit beta